MIDVYVNVHVMFIYIYEQEDNQPMSRCMVYVGIYQRMHGN